MTHERRRKSEIDPINKWWYWVRPYWHVISFLVVLSFIAATKWSTVQAYGDTLTDHSRRLTALEVWQASATSNIAAMKQEIDDIHEAVVKK